jgi:hypothetical protein
MNSPALFAVDEQERLHFIKKRTKWPWIALEQPREVLRRQWITY